MCFNIVKRKHVLISSSGPIKFNVTLLPKNVQAGTEHINMLLYVFKIQLLPIDYASLPCCSVFKTCTGPSTRPLAHCTLLAAGLLQDIPGLQKHSTLNIDSSGNDLNCHYQFYGIDKTKPLVALQLTWQLSLQNHIQIQKIFSLTESM